MKTIVSVQEIEELEVKPPAEVAAWRDLVTRDIERLAADGTGWIASQCPACGSGHAAAAFARAGVPYAECLDCGSLYAVKRMGEAALTAWYRDSAPARFWRDRLLRASDEARREKIVLPRAQWIMDGIAEYVPGAARLLDISANGRPLLDELQRDAQDAQIIAAGYTADIEGPPQGGITVRPTPVSRLGDLGPADVVLAIDVFDRTPDLRALVHAAGRALRGGGVVFATLPVASGFEVQTLWERSATVLPPDKVNLPTIDGLLRLFARPTWELLEVSTPGLFDVEIVRRAVDQSPDADWPRVVRALVAKADAGARAALTEYLQSQRLTSFARIVARKAG